MMVSTTLTERYVPIRSGADDNCVMANGGRGTNAPPTTTAAGRIAAPMRRWMRVWYSTDRCDDGATKRGVVGGVVGAADGSAGSKLLLKGASLR